MASRNNHVEDVFDKVVDPGSAVVTDSHEKAPAKDVSKSGHSRSVTPVSGSNDGGPSTGDDPTSDQTVDSPSVAEVVGVSEGSAEAEDPETSTIADEATDDEHSSPRRGRLRRILRRVAVVAIALIFVGALALSSFLYWQLRQRDEIAAAGNAALDTAKSYAVTISSIDTKNIDQNFAAVIDGATGEFKSMYNQSSAQLRQLLVDNKAVSHGTVIDAAVKSATKTNAAVMLFVDQSVSNSGSPEPRVDRLRITMNMELVDNRWLASNVAIS